MDRDRTIGITTTVPVEVILAAGLAPVDLNNAFITSPERANMIAEAEKRGFPPNLCSWIKGLYGAAKRNGLTKVVGVTRGDCSSTEKLLELWRDEGLQTVDFAYPGSPDLAALQAEIARFARALGTDVDAAEKARLGLAPIRALLEEIDRLTWQENKVTGEENHLWLVSSSDFNGDPARFESEARAFVKEASSRPPLPGGVRLGYVGVPPIVDDLYSFLDKSGARVVFNEVQRQFAMPGPHKSLAEQYASYTYPYDTTGRIEDIKREIARRGLAGILHYAQTFCHRQMESILLKDHLPVPVLVIEADQPGAIDARTRTRIEAVLEQVRA